MPIWSEDLMLRYLWRHFTANQWAAIPQLTVAMGDMNPEYVSTPGEPGERRIDMLCVRRPPKRTDVGAIESLAIEVKVSRSDYLADIRNNEKQFAWRQAATRHTYAVPKGLVNVDEVPRWSGLLTVETPTGTDWGLVEWLKRAPYRPGHAPVLPDRVLQSVNYRLANLEGRTRGWATPDAAGTVQDLRAALQAANKASERDSKARRRAEEREAAWKGAYGLLSAAGHPCRWCGNPVKPKNAGSGTFRSWKHVYPMDNEGCAKAETLVRERQAQISYARAGERQRSQQVTRAHMSAVMGFNPHVDSEPWRAYLEVDSRTFAPRLEGPTPANVLPEGV